jgi:hypothetical protein
MRGVAICVIYILWFGLLLLTLLNTSDWRLWPLRGEGHPPHDHYEHSGQGLVFIAPFVADCLAMNHLYRLIELKNQINTG